MQIAADPGLAEHQDAVRAICRRHGCSDWLEAIEEANQAPVRRAGDGARWIITWAPALAACAAVAFSLSQTNEPLTNWEHNARVVGVIAAPWAAKLAALRLFA